MHNFITKAVKSILLINGICLVAYIISTPEEQVFYAFVGAICLTIYVYID